MSNGKRAYRILIRGTNWIGDSVMSVAALREIRNLYPASHLTLLVKDWVAGIFQEQDLVDEIITFGPTESSLDRIRPYRFRNFDAGILFQNAFEAALILFLSRIPERAGYDTEWRRPLLTRAASPRIKPLKRHQVYYYLDLLYQTGFSGTDYLHNPNFQPDISLIVPKIGIDRAEALLESADIYTDQVLIGLNPGAYYGRAKRWLTERYAALADRLIDELDAKILVFGSKGEKPIAARIEDQMRHTPWILTGRTDLPALMALISRCSVLITNDSGPMHLAASLGTPQIAIFGSTDEIATGPFSENAKVIHKHVECSPCLLRECPIDLRCFTRIEVDEVFETTKAHLGLL
ncbi:MAG: lipopolysaccharide heptosyltransferase II [bacterium]